ncbi:MAG: PH domain-containing protein [Candidatus Niyogibacteria bacterium]|nr:MAG: PH domain-containing protein [Candidatus Niyogibacteria bacterium]
MLELQKEEKVIIAFHRHWIVVANKLTFAALALIPPIVVLILMPTFQIGAELNLLIIYAVIVYLLASLMAAFVIWFDYYLDVWIVTDRRIIDVEQIGMFRRQTSEFMLSRVQDVTVEIPGFIATLLHYGNIRVQTAGEQGFEASDIPNADKIKDIILEEARKTNGHRPEETTNHL